MATNTPAGTSSLNQDGGSHQVGVPRMRTHASRDDGPRRLLNVQPLQPDRLGRTRILRAAGYRVIDATSAAEALAATSRESFAAALVDVHLPDGSGITLCDTLKRLHPGLPVVLVAAVSPSEGARDAALAAGADAYLDEPPDGDVLVNSIEEALEHMNSGRAADVWVVTDRQGFILDASRQGASLLSGTPRGLLQRSLLIFFEQDRDGWRAAMSRAGSGERVNRSGRLRPKERRPVAVRVRIERAVEWGQPALVWSFDADVCASSGQKRPA